MKNFSQNSQKKYHLRLLFEEILKKMQFLRDKLLHR
jgi:hypothetical protein